jgi:hypothetical protein
MISVLREFFRFVLARKRFWLAPLLLVMVAVGCLATLGGGSVVAPLIYTLF